MGCVLTCMCWFVSSGLVPTAGSSCGGKGFRLLLLLLLLAMAALVAAVVAAASEWCVGWDM
jgi:hypothetical protein